MTIYTKDKNIVTLKLHETARNVYTFDINTGKILCNGEYISHFPRIAKKDIPFSKGYCQTELSNLQIAISALMTATQQDNSLYETTPRQYICAALNTADKLDSLGIKVFSYDASSTEISFILNVIAEDFLEYVKWRRAQEKQSGDYSIYVYQNHLKAKKFFQTHPEIPNTPVNSEVVKKYWNLLEEEPFKSNLSIVFYYLINQKIFALSSMINEISSRAFSEMHLIKTYLSACALIGKTPIKTNNLFRELMDTLSTYHASKQKYDFNAFQVRYAPHCDTFNFSYGNYQVIIPTNPNDLIHEGLVMHNCVSSYINKIIIEKSCYIVFVRHKEHLEEPYITAQILPNGQIDQYYHAYNTKITSAENIEFKQAFQEHLNQYWNGRKED